MSESILEGILQEIREIRNEIGEIKSTMATKTELGEIRNEMNAGFEDVHNKMNTGFADLKKTLYEHHSENIRADEKLLEMITATNEKLDQHDQWTKEKFNTHEIKIAILNHKQLELEAEICKMKIG